MWGLSLPDSLSEVTSLGRVRPKLLDSLWTYLYNKGIYMWTFVVSYRRLCLSDALLLQTPSISFSCTCRCVVFHEWYRADTRLLAKALRQAGKYATLQRAMVFIHEGFNRIWSRRTNTDAYGYQCGPRERGRLLREVLLSVVVLLSRQTMTKGRRRKLWSRPYHGDFSWWLFAAH